MPITARERAEKALEKKTAEVDKAREKYTKANSAKQAAEARAIAAAADLVALERERDHLASHPALDNGGQVDQSVVEEAAEVEVDPEPVKEPVAADDFQPFASR